VKGIRFSEPRIIIWMIVVSFAISFSLYKAIGALTMKKSPSIDQPSAAFVQPGTAQITEKAYVVAPRVPTDLEVLVYARTAELGRAAAAERLTVGQLVQSGMGASEARKVVKKLRSVRAGLSGRKATLTGRWSMVSLINDVAVMRAPLMLTDPTGGSPVPGTVSLQWTGQRGWAGARLSALRLSLVQP
jgi:hypothetical protein